MDTDPTNPTDTLPKQPSSAEQPTSAPATQPVDMLASPVPGPAPVDQPVKNPTNRSKIIVPIIAILVLLTGGAAAAYNQLVLNSPEKIWEKSLQTTSGGLKAFLATSFEQQEETGYTVDGSFRFSEPAIIDGAIDGKVNGSNSIFSGNVGFSGVRINGDVMTKIIEGATYPDIYFKADGLESIASLLGLSGQNQQVVDVLNEYNDQWFVVDHTLLEQYQSILQDASGAGGVKPSAVPDLTLESMRELVDASAVIIDEYLFSADDSKAVFMINESFGREEFEGADTYRYAVGVNKENLKSFIGAYVDSIKETAYVSSVLEGSGQSAERAFALEDLYDQIDDADFSDIEAEVWIDVKSKIVRNVRFNIDTSNGKPNYIEFGLPYDGGDDIPFTMKVVLDEKTAFSSVKGEIMFVTGYNIETRAVSLSFDIDLDLDGNKIVGSSKLSIAASDEEVDVTVPTDATNVLDLLGATPTSSLDQLLNLYTTPITTPDDLFIDGLDLPQEVQL